MNTIEEQIYAQLQCICENNLKSPRMVDCPYFYVTYINTSLNPPCRKVGMSNGEQIRSKLKRYSTSVPQDWQPYAVVFLDKKHGYTSDDENEFIDTIDDKNTRRGSKELIRSSNSDIIEGIAKFINSFKHVRAIMLEGKLFTLSDFVKFAKNEKDKKTVNNIPSDIAYILKDSQKDLEESFYVHCWAHMLDEAFNKEQFLCEDREGKNINRAEKWIKDNHPELIGKEINGRMMSRARDVVTQVRHDIPAARLPYDKDTNGQRIKVKLSNGDIIDKGTCKYLPGICRIYLNGLLSKTYDQAQQAKLASRLSDLVNVIATQFDNDFKEDDNGRDLNHMSFDELESKYGNYVEELKRKEREEAKKTLNSLKKNEDYDIVKIKSFADAKRFSRYVSWCVTKDKSLFDDYTDSGEKTFYFAIRKDFKDVAKDDPSYATSMLAILTHPDGSMDSSNGCTSRLNNGGKFMDPKQVQDLLGVDFYKIFSDDEKAKELQDLKEHANEEVEKILSRVSKIKEDTIPKTIRKYVTTIVIPDRVTSIGDYAFWGCSSLMSVTIPDSVMSIGEMAFEYCDNSLYDTTTIPGVKLVDGWAVDGSPSGNLNLTGARGIGSSTFYSCRRLKSVMIPGLVTHIGDSAFKRCSGLTSVIIGNGITSIGDYAFDGCDELTNLTFEGKTLKQVKKIKGYPWGIKDESTIRCER